MSANDELQAHTCEKILQEYGDIANNVAQGKVQDLTEQWKKGELEEGFYYIIKKNGNEEFDYWFGEFWENSWNFDIKEVLAPVPSYEEWQAKDSQIDYLQQKVSVLESKNQQLKELLKECRNDVNHIISNVHLCKELLDLLTKIDNAIGEKK